jgi:hypothetical protein
MAALDAELAATAANPGSVVVMHGHGRDRGVVTAGCAGTWRRQGGRRVGGGAVAVRADRDAAVRDRAGDADVGDHQAGVRQPERAQSSEEIDVDDERG